MIGRIHILWAGLVLAIATGLFTVSYAVDDRRDHLRHLNSEIKRVSENYHVLKAEWSYLNDPERLSSLVDSVGEMETIRPDHYTDIASLPLRPPPVAPVDPASVISVDPTTATESDAAADLETADTDMTAEDAVEEQPQTAMAPPPLPTLKPAFKPTQRPAQVARIEAPAPPPPTVEIAPAPAATPVAISPAPAPVPVAPTPAPLIPASVNASTSTPSAPVTAPVRRPFGSDQWAPIALTPASDTGGHIQ